MLSQPCDFKVSSRWLGRYQIILPGKSGTCVWTTCPGLLPGRWVDQIRRDNNLPPADLLRRAVNRGHCGVMLPPLPAKRWAPQPAVEPVTPWSVVRQAKS